MRSLSTIARAAPRALRPSARYTPASRCLHSSAPQHATPLPHPTAPGPPPDPPKPAASTAEDRIARKRERAEQFQQSRNAKADPSKPGSALKKRFWTDVHVKQTSDGHQIFLDSRPVRTASKNVLTIPPNKQQLAAAIALEWDLLLNAQQALKQHYIPLTSLTSRAIDIQAEDAAGDTTIRAGIIQMLMRYLTTDTLLCWAPAENIHDPKDLSEGAKNLRQVQIQTAQPIINFLSTKLWPGVEIRPILEPDSIMPVPQPQNTVEVVKGWLSSLPAWELAGVERGVLASKSLLIASRLMAEWSPQFAHARESQPGGSRFGIEEAAEASSLEVAWQTGMWGEVEDTHDVDKEDLRRQLGSVVILVNG
ncbi:ATP synthase mitochondrial F1 complex assembly factor 2 [Diplodia intermedia]|uniref:ATP synthase mitochondrial F1 complex assembly factor 2 n=1 Tax=Diplodia intermedia TaxID=856260 RepID=A0ABR3TRC0_9PEZI